MDIVEVISRRKSIRAFKPDPVPRTTLESILRLAVRAPSWANTQPWTFAVAAGIKMEELRDAFTERSSEAGSPDLGFSVDFPEPYDSRRRTLGRKIFEIRKIGREDREQRELWRVQGLRLFEAPSVIYVCTERPFYMPAGGPNVWPIFDCALVAENIMLLATNCGLGTLPHPARYPDIVRSILGLPPTRLLVLGIAIGYPDWDDPVNRFTSERDDLDRLATWHGFNA